MTKEDFTTVSIPKPLAKELDKMRKDSGFTSTSAIATHLLRRCVRESKIKGRIKLLGY